MSTCVCCGRPTYSSIRVSFPTGKGRIHDTCWDAHHSDPTGVWPEDHICAAAVVS